MIPFQCIQVHEIRPIEWHPTKFYQEKGPSEWFGAVNRTGSTNRRLAADRSQAADQSVHWIEQNAPRQGIRSTVNGRALVFDALFTYKRLTFSFQIFGISVNSNGYSWLQSVTLHERIQFMPISKSNVNYAECQVALLQSNKVRAGPHYSCFPARTRQITFEYLPFAWISSIGQQTNIDLAEALISLGFARHDKSAAADTKDAQLAKYLKGLERTQAKATRKPFPWPIGKLESLLTQLIYDKVLPRKYSLPKLVR